MIPKSGHLFSEKIMAKQKMSDESDSAKLDQTPANSPCRAFKGVWDACGRGS
jgi:hypothetical protein